MKIWQLGQRHDTNTIINPNFGYEDYAPDSPWRAVYDCAHGFIIQAETEGQARLIASDNHGDEGSDAWLSPKWSYCVELIVEGKSGVIMRDFHAA